MIEYFILFVGLLDTSVGEGKNADVSSFWSNTSSERSTDEKTLSRLERKKSPTASNLTVDGSIDLSIVVLGFGSMAKE